MRLRFEILGPVRAWRGEDEIELGSPQQRAVLAVLLLQAGTPVSADQLVSAVWGDVTPRAATGMVRSYVSRLRRALDPERQVIRSVGGGYALPTGSLDLAEFDRYLGAAREATRSGDAVAAAVALRSALALWHGAPLAGIPGEYAESERVRLRRLRLTAVEDLAAADVQQGRHVDAVPALLDVIAEEPLRERPRELLMLALYRSGRQAEALAVFDEVRRLLDSELGLYPGAELREMQRRILAADPALDHPVLAASPTPAQLPPDVPDFVGRADLAARITAALAPTGGSVPVVGLEGLAGVGKTALAVHVGHAVATHFPDGQLFVDLATADPLAALLRGVGVPDSGLPESASERGTLWRTVTAGRRLLVVVDDARDADQVRPLLPGAGGSAVVVTARQRLYGLPSELWLTLRGLSEDDSTALLARIVGAERLSRDLAATRNLVLRTAGLPQVLRAVGGRIAARPGWTMADAIRRLRPPEPGIPVRSPECASIERPYESALARLTPVQARVFRLLSVSEGPDISIPAAAAALDLPVGPTEALLESLVDVHLLEPAGIDTYRYQEPLRAFARTRARVEDGPEDTDAALTRLILFYSDRPVVGSGRP